MDVTYNNCNYWDQQCIFEAPPEPIKCGKTCQLKPSKTFEPPEPSVRLNAWNTASTSYSTCGTVRNPICARVPPGTLVLRTSCQGLGPRTDSEPDSQNLLDKPRSPKKINLVSQDLQTPPLEKLSGSSGTRLLEPSQTRTGTTPTASLM